MLETDEFWIFSQFHPLIFQTIADVQGTRLGGCMIARMPPNSEIPEHKDAGPCGFYYDRFHIVLKSKDVDFYCGDEVVQMKEGELWWFDQTLPHKVINKSDEDRIHLIMDIKTLRDGKWPTPN